MKLLLHIDSLARGGSQQQLVNLATGMAARSHDVTIVTYAPENAHKAVLEQAGVKTTCTDKRGRFDLMPLLKLMKIIRSTKPDCIVAFLRTPGFYAEAARWVVPGTPLIVSERAGLRNGRLRVSDKAAGIFHLLASRVCSNSRSYLGALCASFPFLRKRSSVIYNGVADQYFQAHSGTPLHAVPDIESANAECVKLLVVSARPCKDKGLFVLIDALASVVSSGRANVRLYWGGPCDASHPLVNGDEIARAHEKIKSSGLQNHWHWLGPISQLHTVYPLYDALLLPSLHEGTPNVMCEAMSCSLPVVVTDIADNSVLVRQGVDGFVCKVDSVAALADAIEKICVLSPLDRQSLGRNANAQATKYFSMDKYLNSWEALILGIDTPVGG